MKHPGPWSRVCTGPTVNIVHWYSRWFPVTASTYSDVDVCELGRYDTYLDIWVGWVIRLNIKSGNNDSFGFYHLQHVVPPLHAYYSCTHNTTFNAHPWYIYSHTLSFICHLAVTWTSVGEVLTPLNLYVQVLKLGLKWSPPPKIKLSSRSRLTSLDSFRIRLFLLARGIFLQLMSILYYSYCKTLLFYLTVI